MTILVTGSGFIGANFVLGWLASSQEPMVNLDKLTYAGNLETLASLQGEERPVFVQANIADGYPQALRDLRPMGRGRAAAGQTPAAVDATGICARLPGAERQRGFTLQEH